MGSGDAIGSFFYLIAARPINVAYSHDLEFRAGGVGSIEQVSHATAGPNDADAKRVVGTQDSGRSKSSHSTCNDETAAIGRKCHEPPGQLVPDDLISQVRSLS
jgi:hypothetical protein